MLYKLTIYPVEVIYKALYLFISGLIGSYGISLILLSITTTILILPFMRWANRMQANEKHVQDVMAPQIEKIKNESAGAQRHERITKLYRRYAYHPVMAVRSAAGVALQIPFLMAAYYMLSSLPNIQGQSFLVIKDLSKPDGLLWGINLLPILMTVINLISAWTTPNFKKKDKIQAAVIAFLFLLLLYTAPSALLVFWTCNNLWVLLGNVVCWKNVIVVPILCPIGIQKEGILLRCYKNDVFILFVCIFLSLTTPISRLIAFNSEYFSVLSLCDVIVVVLMFTVPIFILFMIIVRMEYLRNLAGLFARTLLLTSVFNTLILPIKLDTIDGNAASFMVLREEAFVCLMISIVLVILVYLFFIRTEAKYSKYIVKIIGNASVYAIFISVGFLFYSICIFYPVMLHAHGDAYVSDVPVLSATKKNIFVICFDQVQGSAMEGYLREHSAVRDVFNGFTFFCDNAATYPNTGYSMGALLLGRIVKQDVEEGPHSVHGSMESFMAKSAVCGADVYTNFTMVHPENLFYKINLTGELYKDGARSFVRRVELLRHGINIAYGLDFLKLLPHTALTDKIKVYVDNVWHIDLNSFSEFSEQMRVGNEKTTVFFLYFAGTHQPFIYDSDCNIKTQKMIDTSQNLNGAKEQVACVAKLLETFLNKLRRLNAYDNSMIFIVADHGYEANINNCKDAKNLYLPDVAHVIGNSMDIKPTGCYNPMMFFKDFNDDNKFRFSNAPTSLIDVAPTVLDALGSRKYEESFAGINIRKNKFLSRKRYFWQYHGGQERRDKDGTDKYSNGLKYWHKKSFIGPIYPNLAFALGLSKDVYYNRDLCLVLNMKLLFGKNGLSHKCCAVGWGTQEPNFRWTDGKNAYLQFNVGNVRNRNLLMRVNASAYLAGILPCQEVTVFVNDTKIAVWRVCELGWYEAVIPAWVVGSGRLNVKFTISNPISPKEAGESEDSRQLGIAVRELVVTESKR